MAETLALRQTFTHRLAGIEHKDIYGPGWRAFQGISGDSGGSEIEDNPRGYSQARIAESYIFRAQDVRGSAIDSVPLRVWQTDERGRRSAVAHPALEILEQTCAAGPDFDPYVTGASSLMRYTLLALDGHGRSGWQLAFDGRGMPSEVYWLVPTAFTPLHGYEVRQNAPFGGLQYTTGGERRVLKPEQVVYFQTDNPDDPILGTSKVSILRSAINLRMYSMRSNRDFFKNSMRPDWILTGDWKNSEENVERIKRGLRRHYTGESNREPLVLGEGSTAHLLTTSQKDAEWQAMMRIVQEEISAIYGVPVVYLNNMERATFQNIETAKLMLWHDTMMPETKKLAAMLTRRFLNRFWPDTRAKGLEFGFDYNTVTGLNEDVARIWERFNALIDRLAVQVERRELTPNQARQAMAALAEQLGLDPTPWKGDLPDGNTFYLQSNFLPTDQLSVQAEINIQAARSSNPNAIDLIESVPGAPNVGQNAQLGISRLTALQQQQLQAQQARATAKPQQSDLEAEVVEIKALLAAQQAPAPRVVVKAPNPTPIREARLAPIQKRLIADLKSHFQGLQTESLRKLRKAKAFKADGDNLYDREKSKDGIRAIIRTGVVDSAAAAYAASAEDFNLSVNLSDDDSFVERHMGKRLHLINGIDDTTAKALADTLAEGADAGDSMLQLADRVSAVFSDAIDTRAETIARTETMQAYGAASLQAYKDAGIEQVQLYDGSDDPECAARDGMVVSPDEADAMLGDEHPNGTLALAPVVDLGYAPETATFVFNTDGVAVA